MNSRSETVESLAAGVDAAARPLGPVPDPRDLRIDRRARLRAFATPLLQPLVDVALREHWSMLWVRPTIIWISMGLGAARDAHGPVADVPSVRSGP